MASEVVEVEDLEPKDAPLWARGKHPPLQFTVCIAQRWGDGASKAIAAWPNVASSWREHEGDAVAECLGRIASLYATDGSKDWVPRVRR
jgi:hypothetical protein